MIKTSKFTEADSTILKIEGRIDGLTSKQVQSEIAEIIATNVKNVILDFTAVYYLSSAGLRVLINEVKKIKDYGGQMFILSPVEIIQKELEVSGLSTVFNVYHSLQEISDFLNEGD